MWHMRYIWVRYIKYFYLSFFSWILVRYQPYQKVRKPLIFTHWNPKQLLKFILNNYFIFMNKHDFPKILGSSVAIKWNLGNKRFLIPLAILVTHVMFKVKILLNLPRSAVCKSNYVVLCSHSKQSRNKRQKGHW